MKLKELLSESVPTDNSWYVLDVRKRTILASELTREDADEKAKELNGTVWFTENGVFYSPSRSVSYSGMGWDDKS
jgi:hypothetical protein